MVVQYRNASYILRQYTVHAYNALWTPTNRDFPQNLQELIFALKIVNIASRLRREISI